MNKVMMLRAQSNCKVMGYDLLSDSLGAMLKSPDIEPSVSRNLERQPTIWQVLEDEEAFHAD